MRTTTKHAKKLIRQGLQGRKLGRFILKSSFLAASLAVVGNGAALANESRQDSKSTTVNAPLHEEQVNKESLSYTSSATDSEFAVQYYMEGNPAIAYVPAYRTGLRWKN